MNNEQKLIIAHVVVDADAWYQHAINTFGQEKADKFLKEKVAKHKPSYEEAIKKPDYKNRFERDQELLAEQAKRLQELQGN